MRADAHSSMILRPVPPFRLDFTVWALRRRARNAIDRWDGTIYRRIVVLGSRPTELAVRQEGRSSTPRLIVTVTPPFQTQFDRKHLRRTIVRLLGLRVDLARCVIARAVAGVVEDTTPIRPRAQRRHATRLLGLPLRERDGTM